MIITCPACHTRAELPSSKEGAKVRCGNCSRIYVARVGGARARKSTNTVPIILGAAAVVLFGVLMMVFQGSGTESQASEPVTNTSTESEAVTDSTGWDSELVQRVRRIHEAAYLRDTTRLTDMLYPALIWARAKGATEEADEDQTPEERERAISDAIAEYDTLASHERMEFFDGVVEDLTKGEGAELVAGWKAYDGNVISEDDREGIVRVLVQSNDSSVSESRTVEWKLIKDGRHWKAWSWERWYSPEERKAQRVQRSKITQKRTLSDGSVVIEAEPRPLEHLEDTPADVRARIDALYVQLIDFSLHPRENAKAKAQLVLIGKPSLPILLTGLYEIPLETEEQAIQVNLINQCLEEITGFYTGYKPQLVEGSGTGTSAERRGSAIKQWFGWWFRKGKRFEKNENEDMLEEVLQPTTERERRDLEKYKREHEKTMKEREQGSR